MRVWRALLFLLEKKRGAARIEISRAFARETEKKKASVREKMGEREKRVIHETKEGGAGTEPEVLMGMG